MALRIAVFIVSAACSVTLASTAGCCFAERAAARAGELARDGFAGSRLRRKILVGGLFCFSGAVAACSLSCDWATACFRVAETQIIAAMLVADVRFRFLPIECNRMLAAVGLVSLLLVHPEDLVANLLIGGLILAVTLGVSQLATRNGDPLVGGGDVAAFPALSLAAGGGCLMGALVCFAAAALWGLICSWREKRSGAPDALAGAFSMAPFLAVWFVVSIATG